MTIDAKAASRKTLTLAWRAEAGTKVPVVEESSDLVEVPSADCRAVASPRPMPIAGVIDDTFAKRMENWRKTVSGSVGGGSGACCAGWARLYVAAQLKKENDARAAAMIPPESMLRTVTVDELDGWLVEAAVRSLADFDQRKVLHYWHVRLYPEHWIKTKLMLRAASVRLVLGRAEKNLCDLLDKLGSASKIRSNNSHAGIDPRPESQDAPMGAAASLENEEA